MSSSVPQYTRPTTSTNSPYLQALDDEPSAPPPASPPQYEPVASTSTSYSATADSSSTSATTHTTAKPERIPTPQRTLSSLSNKKCWVCFEEEAESTEQREWVHACKCTLVAHSDCLLAWYATSVSTHQTQPKCPVCATPYIVQESTSALLTLYKAAVRRWDKAATIVAFGGVLGSAWLVAAAYGAHTVRVWAGDEVARTLLWGAGENGRRAWRYWLNLPLIPLTLLLSRTPLIDSLLPFLPLTLVLSTSSHPLPLTHDPLGLTNLAFTYPPSPTLTLCLLPWARWVYLGARARVFDWALGRSARLDGWQGIMQSMQAADEGGFEAGVAPGRLEVVAEVVEEEQEQEQEGAPPAHQQQQQQQQQQGADADADARPLVANRLRVGLSRLTSLIVGALLYPTLCSLAGSALFWLASRGGPHPTSGAIRALRRVLGVSAVLGAGVAATPLSSTMGWLRLLSSSTAPLLRSRSAGQKLVDPVWIRTSIGGGLILLGRDVVELGAGVLERRRKGSRRIVGRELGGLQWEDDEAPAVTTGREVSSGGRDAQGREAIVHTVL